MHFSLNLKPSYLIERSSLSLRVPTPPVGWGRTEEEEKGKHLCPLLNCCCFSDNISSSILLSSYLLWCNPLPLAVGAPLPGKQASRVVNQEKNPNPAILFQFGITWETHRLAIANCELLINDLERSCSRLRALKCRGPWQDLIQSVQEAGVKKYKLTL